MCGRLNVISDPLGQLILEITGRGFEINTRLNLAPTEPVPVLRAMPDGWDLSDMRWWLTPSWSDGPSNQYSMFNARAETLAKSRAFREPFARRRCIVPASGYFEWRKEGSTKVPFYITPAADPGFAFAALWDRWQGEWQGEDRVIESCTIVTAAAPEAMAFVHHRIPVHLTAEQVDAWVNAETSSAGLAALLAPTLRVPVAVTPVSTHVNNARHKDERCIEPIGEPSIVT